MGVAPEERAHAESDVMVEAIATTKPTKEKWAELEKGLSISFGYAKLRVDGHELALAVQKWKGLTYRIMVYVDGFIDYKRMEADKDLRAKFWRRETVCYARKRRGEKLTKRTREFIREKMTFEHFRPDWKSAGAFRRHITKTANSIEVLSTGIDV
jgi:hypothetical protein